MNAESATTRRWWGEQVLAEGTSAYWRIGPLGLWLSRTAHEWSLSTENGDDPLQDELLRENPTTRPLPGPDVATRRFGFRRTRETVVLEPVLADRPVVIDPATPFSLPPGEELTLYLSTALWVRLRTGEPLTDLVEVPTYRPSDTWLGPSTREGELCYAGRTSARHQLENVPVRPHRAISAVRVKNRAATPLTVERLKLPLPNMTLFESEDGELWTESVTLHRELDDEHAELVLDGRPPAHVAGARQLSGRRVEPAGGGLIRAFGGLIRWIW